MDLRKLTFVIVFLVASLAQGLLSTCNAQAPSVPARHIYTLKDTSYLLDEHPCVNTGDCDYSDEEELLIYSDSLSESGLMWRTGYTGDVFEFIRYSVTISGEAPKKLKVGDIVTVEMSAEVVLDGDRGAAGIGFIGFRKVSGGFDGGYETSSSVSTPEFLKRYDPADAGYKQRFNDEWAGYPAMVSATVELEYTGGSAEIEFYATTEGLSEIPEVVTFAWCSDVPAINICTDDEGHCKPCNSCKKRNTCPPRDAMGAGPQEVLAPDNGGSNCSSGSCGGGSGGNSENSFDLNANFDPCSNEGGSLGAGTRTNFDVGTEFTRICKGDRSKHRYLAITTDSCGSQQAFTNPDGSSDFSSISGSGFSPFSVTSPGGTPYTPEQMENLTDAQVELTDQSSGYRYKLGAKNVTGQNNGAVAGGFVSRLEEVISPEGPKITLGYITDERDAGNGPHEQLLIASIADEYGVSAVPTYGYDGADYYWTSLAVTGYSGQADPLMLSFTSSDGRFSSASVDGTEVLRHTYTASAPADFITGSLSFTYENFRKSGSARKSTVVYSGAYQEGGDATYNQYEGFILGRLDGSGQVYSQTNLDSSQEGVYNIIYRGQTMEWVPGQSLKYGAEDSYAMALGEPVDGEPGNVAPLEDDVVAGTPPRIIDETGYIVSVQYDDRRNPTKITYPSGSYELTLYDDNNLVVYRRDREGYVTVTERGDQGRILRQITGLKDKDDQIDEPGLDGTEDPISGKPLQTVYQYVASGNGEGQVAWMASDVPYALGDPIPTVPANERIDYEYNSDNRLVKQTQPLPHDGETQPPTIEYVWDGARLVSVINERGAKTSYMYDSLGRVISTEYSFVNGDGNETDGGSEEVWYDDTAPFRSVYRKDRNGIVSKTSYDQAWRMKTVQSAYAKVDSFIEITRADLEADDVRLPVHLQNKTTYTYLPGETRRSSMQRNGQTTAYSYDYRGRNSITAYTPRLGVSRSTENIYQNNLLFVTRETFDNGTDSFLQNTYRGYSSDRQTVRLVKQKNIFLGDADGNGVVDFSDISAFIGLLQSGGYNYAADINQDAVVDFQDLPLFITALMAGGTSLDFADNAAVMAATRVDRNEIARVREITDAIRDERGNIVSMIDEYGAKTLSMYDEHSRKVEEFQAYDTDQQLRTLWSYDDRGRMEQTTNPADVVTKYTFDDADNIKSMIVGFGADDALETLYGYDPDGVQSSVTSPTGATTETIRKDCCGRSRGNVDGFGHGTITNMDPGGRTVHTAQVEAIVGHSDYHNPIDEKTLRETTTRYYDNGQVQFRTVWKKALGYVDVNAVPIAGVGDVDGNDGVTTQYLYDTHIGDGLGLDSVSGAGSDDKVSASLLLRENTAGGSVEVNIQSALDKLAEPIADGGAGITFTPTHGGSATVVIAPDELTMRLSISDGMGRSVMNALLHGPRATTDEAGESVSVGGLIDSSCTLHDQVESISEGNFGTMESIAQIDSAGKTIKTLSDDLGYPRGSIDQEGYITRRLNGPKGQPRHVYDALSQMTEFKYDILGRQVEMVDPLDRTTQTTYDAGRVSTRVDAKGKSTLTEYDDLSRVWRVRDRSGHWTERMYDGAGRLKTIRDAQDKVTTYGYDLDRRTSVALDDGSVRTMKYDAAGRVIEIELHSGKKITRSYRENDNDVSGMLREVKHFDSSGDEIGIDTYSYDAFLRPAGTTSRYGVTTAMTYTNRGQVETESTTYGNQVYPVTYGYDNRNRLTEVTYPSGKKVDYTHTDRSELDLIKWDGSQIEDRDYDELGRLESVSRPSVVDESRSYFADSRIQSISNVNVGAATYAYDANGNKLSETFDGVMSAHSFETFKSGTEFPEGYDEEDRFMNFVQGGNDSTFARSLIGNITDINLNGVGTTRGYSEVHELTSIGPNNQDFDVDGNLSVHSSGMLLDWDSAGMLEKVDNVSTDAGLISVEYGYTAEGKRVYERKSGSSEVVFVHAGPNCIAEYTSGQAADSPEVEFVYGQSIDSLVLVDTGTNKLAVLRNQQWSVTALINNATGSVAERYAYDHFGKRTILTGDGANVLEVSSHKNPYGYTSRRHEDETGLMYYRARYYDPETGEFISRDPLEYVDGMSLYRGYFALGGVDPLGLSWNALTNPFLYHYYFGDGENYDLVAAGFLPRLKNRLGSSISTAKSRIETEIRNQLGSCRGETENFFAEASGDAEEVSYNVGNLWGTHLGMLGGGTLLYSYNCSALRECKKCPCSFGLGESSVSQTTIRCSITFSLRDAFSNPADIRGVHVGSPVFDLDERYRGCETQYLADLDAATTLQQRTNAANRRWHCRRQAQRELVNREIERYNRDVFGIPGSGWLLGQYTGTPYSLTGSWDDTINKVDGTLDCNPF